MAITTILRGLFRRMSAPTQQQGQYVNAERVTNNYQDLEQLYNYWASNPTVFACVDLISDKVSQATWSLSPVTDQRALKSYKLLSRGATDTAQSRATVQRGKALGQVKDTSGLTDLLNRPNERQGQDTFIKHLVMERLLGGAGVVWANNGGLESVKKPAELWVLPTMDVQLKTRDLFTISGYAIDSLPSIRLAKEQVLYWAYPNPLFDTSGSHLYGFAPLRAAFIDLITSEEGRRTMATNFKNGGGKGVLFEDATGDDWGKLTPEQIADIRRTVNDQINGNRNSNRVAFIGKKLGYHALANTNDEMKLVEGLKVNDQYFCNVFGVNPVLLNPAESSYSNMLEAGRGLVTNVAMPLATSLRDELNRWLLPMFNLDPTKWFLDVDFSDLPEMQVDMGKTAEALERMPYLTYDEKRAVMKYDPKGKAYDTAYIPSSVVPIDEAGMTDIQLDTNDTDVI